MEEAAQRTAAAALVKAREVSDTPPTTYRTGVGKYMKSDKVVVVDAGFYMPKLNGITDIFYA